MELASSGGIAVGGAPRKLWITGLVSAVDDREREKRKEKGAATLAKETFPLPLFLRGRSSRMEPIVNYSTRLEG